MKEDSVYLNHILDSIKRDMLIHHYFDVDDQQLWKIIEDDLPKLKISIEKILNKNA